MLENNIDSFNVVPIFSCALAGSIWSDSLARYRFETLPHFSRVLEFSPLAAKQNAVNLGQGFPNFAPPEFLLEAAEKAQRGATGRFSFLSQWAITSFLAGTAFPGPALINQYARPGGHLRLVKALAKLYLVVPFCSTLSVE